MSPADAGVAGVGCGVPLGGLEGVVELLAEVGDLGGVGRPRRLRGVEVGLERGQVDVGLGAGRAADSVEPADQLVAPFDEAAADGVEPVRDLRPGRPGRRRDLAGEVAALGDGGDVGAVVGQDVLEDVAGFGRVGGVGDDEEVVGVASSGRADVQAAVGGGAGDELVGDVDGVALVAVLGRRVPQAGRARGHTRPGRVTVPCPARWDTTSPPSSSDAGDGPAVAVADRLTCGGEELTVVAAGHHDITDMRALAVSDRDGAVGVEVAGV